MIKKIIFTIGLVCFTITICAQKKELSQAQQWIKQGKNIEKAEASMLNLLKDSTNRQNKKIWLTLFEAIKAQYEQGNEKLYLKQKYDTAQIFLLTKKMFDVVERFDSIDAAPNKRGKIKIRYRDEHAQYLHPFRPNLYNGGAYFINKKKYQQAYQMYNAYVFCAYTPLFKKYNYLKNDKRLPEAAYWAAYCAYKIKNYKATLKHATLALQDSIRQPFMLQYLANIYEAKKDTAMYLKTLNDGFAAHPKFPFFFPHLVDYYMMHKQLDKAQIVINKALATDSTNQIYLFAQCNLFLNMGKYNECIDICKELIAKNDTLIEPYLNAGLAYFNQAVILDKDTQISKKKRKKVLQYYQKALPYLEHYRKLAPNKKDKWISALYTIYLNLNMGKEFDEIDKLIKEKEK